MKHVAWGFSGFQTHSDRCRFGTQTVRVRSLKVQDGNGQDFWNSCRWWERLNLVADKTFQPIQDSSAFTGKYFLWSLSFEQQYLQLYVCHDYNKHGTWKQIKEVLTKQPKTAHTISWQGLNYILCVTDEVRSKKWKKSQMARAES